MTHATFQATKLKLRKKADYRRGPNEMEMISLAQGSRSVVETCMAVKRDESVLVITDTNELRIATAFLLSAHAVGADAVMTIMKPRSRHGEEPPRSVADAMKNSNVILIPTSYSLTHTKARIEATKAGARVASTPGITEDMITIGGLTADYTKVCELSTKLTNLLKQTKEVRITTPAGTDVKMIVENATKCPPETGMYVKPGDFGNLPAGEAATTPVEGTAEGIFVVDGVMAPLGLLRDPIRLTIESGRIVKIEGKEEAGKLEAFLESLADPYAFWVAELGIGTNEKARLTGNILESEKVIGTVHLGFGTNVSMGGNIKSKTHNDGIVLQPTVELDGKAIMRDGKIEIL